jgi:hypothetical protein
MYMCKQIVEYNKHSCSGGHKLLGREPPGETTSGPLRGNKIQSSSASRPKGSRQQLLSKSHLFYFSNYMHWDIFSKLLILHNYTLFFHCYDHVTCNRVCFVTCWMTDHSHTILLLGIFNTCINIVIVEYIYRASSWPYSQNLTSCQLQPNPLYPSTKPMC